MFLKSNFINKPSLVKPVGIAILASLIIGGGIFIFKNNKNSNDSENKNHSGIDPSQRVYNVGDVEKVITKWVEENPQAIINSVANMQKKMMEEQNQNAQKNIGEKKNELLDKSSPSYSPKGYDVTIVQFFDYNCGYCKKANPTIESLIKSDSKIRIIYKEFPILGQLSEDLSKIALAVHIAEPNSYKKFHDGLMNSNTGSKEDALKLAASLGINASKVESTLKTQKDKIEKIINDNRTLGSSIGISGTPAFVIDEELIPGAMEESFFKKKVEEVRKK